MVVLVVISNMKLSSMKTETTEVPISLTVKNLKLAKHYQQVSLKLYLIKHILHIKLLMILLLLLLINSIQLETHKRLVLLFYSCSSGLIPSITVILLQLLNQPENYHSLSLDYIQTKLAGHYK